MLFKRFLLLALTFCLLSCAFADSIQGAQMQQQTEQTQQAQQAQQGQQAQQAQQQQNWNHGGQQLTISQNKTNAWEDNGVQYSVFEVTLVNCGTTTIYDATVVAESNFIITKPSDVWTVEKVSENRYHFPSYLCQNGLEAGKNITFGYINKSTGPAVFSVCDLQFK
ncbi:hypothetical protein DICPUDRAFT_93241 [Dictyostelium purpureum]|uniref:Carbohydrate binding domain-containing protein n=1 Tax=Dictyostelium purpureum TaxID=5786 RepID=F1A4E4_DICPU|nr:uncharacterized protein DICPUDRAFT_93241 [Dictyostelium purpureum]EGC28936.1 hypothetical protein DICPUDRAFT_93241 [Dictyostelium purpureum]|eukprot:XP_003294537.1 hypothetical protein DICPUDRAFT_93241 [Dictyostelium purpureum]